ncbi:MAG: hypothetical protein U5L00_18935 [Desulfovermiculus sp.]|nr:hypothetical protein [Desulfovermiculus sp.]
MTTNTNLPIVGSGSWIEGSRFVPGTSDFDMRVIVRGGSPAEQMREWAKTQQGLTKTYQREIRCDGQTKYLARRVFIRQISLCSAWRTLRMQKYFLKVKAACPIFKVAAVIMTLFPLTASGERVRFLIEQARSLMKGGYS